VLGGFKQPLPKRFTTFEVFAATGAGRFEPPL